ncbi:hypothetical protein H4S03_000091 [Coemansia sp. S3946]|nr:hypothetical protein H4S03_000091 [Coemansia sp. S3946]
MALDRTAVSEPIAKCREVIAQGQDLQKLTELVQYGVSGSCGLVAIVDTNAKEIVVGNVGDSRALVGVLQDDGTWKAIRLTEDQTASNPDEHARVLSEHPGEDTAIRGGRVLGSLMPTRAFGGMKYKWPLDAQQEIFPFLYDFGYRRAHTPEHCLTPPYVTAEPVVTRHKLSSNDKFMVLASDGLYDNLSDDQVVEAVAQWYEANKVAKNESAGSLAVKDGNAATHLIRAALSIDWKGTQGSLTARRLLAIPSPHSRRYRDDISATVVTLDMDTGASSGIGEACAYQFAAAGANVILGARRVDRLSTVSDTIRSKYPSVTVEAIELDVRNSEAVNLAISSITKDIDVLVNNAGLAMGTDTVDNLSDAAIDAVIDTNVKGLLYVSRAVVRRMKQQGHGHVIMMGSIAGLVGYPTGSVYCASKAAVRAITESLRAETIGVPIRVTEIKPGMVETEFSVVRYGGDKDRASSVYKGIEPMTADDVAESVVFAASRHPRCVVADVVLLATGQASATLSHRK